LVLRGRFHSGAPFGVVLRDVFEKLAVKPAGLAQPRPLVGPAHDALVVVEAHAVAAERVRAASDDSLRTVYLLTERSVTALHAHAVSGLQLQRFHARAHRSHTLSSRQYGPTTRSPGSSSSSVVCFRVVAAAGITNAASSRHTIQIFRGGRFAR